MKTEMLFEIMFSLKVLEIFHLTSNINFSCISLVMCLLEMFDWNEYLNCNRRGINYLTSFVNTCISRHTSSIFEAHRVANSEKYTAMKIFFI